MVIALIILAFVWIIPMVLYIIWKRGDWYLFLFPMIISFVISSVLALISNVLSIIFAIMVAIYCIYNLTNKKAKCIRREIKLEREALYKDYRKDEADNQVKFKNYILPSGKKIEYIDFKTKTFYILRPYVKNYPQKYKRQIQKYLNELEELYGNGWSYDIDTF